MCLTGEHPADMDADVQRTRMEHAEAMLSDAVYEAEDLRIVPDAPRFWAVTGVVFP